MSISIRYSEFAHQPLDVALRADIVANPRESAVGINHECGTAHTHVRLAIIHLLTPYAELLMQVSFLIDNQVEIQSLLLDELRM